jgi:ribosome-associated protein
MKDDDEIRINSRMAIPRSELRFKASRSGGPGGQHVNTSSSRIEVVWNVAESEVLTEAERGRLLTKLATRLDSFGQLRVVSQEERSQLRNRQAATERLADVVARALVVPKRRKPTKPTRASKERRLEAKRKQGQKKRERRKKGDE